jgi:lysophospholipase L1-like esterase
MLRALQGLVTIVVVLVASTANATTVINGGELMLYTGDSITANGWPTISGGLQDQINSQFANHVGPIYSTLAGGSTVATLKAGSTTATVASVTTRKSVRSVNTGVAGNQTADIAAAVSARITNYNPDVITILIGINDIFNSINPATTQANYTSILTQIRSWSSSVRIVLVSVLVYGEHWASGPLRWGPNTPDLDAGINSLNATIQGLAATYNCTYIDMRTPLLTWESLNNTPEPGVHDGPFAGGGPHPTIPAGEILMGNWGIGSFTVTP